MAGNAALKANCCANSVVATLVLLSVIACVGNAEVPAKVKVPEQVKLKLVLDQFFYLLGDGLDRT